MVCIGTGKTFRFGVSRFHTQGRPSPKMENIPREKKALWKYFWASNFHLNGHNLGFHPQTKKL